VTTYRFDRCEVRPAERQLLVDGQPVPIGARAFDLLLALIERRDRVVSKNELLDVVWPGLVVEENNLQVQVGALRKVLGQNAIATVPGRGYRFTLQPEEDKASSLAPIPAANNTQSHPVVEAPVPAAPADARGPTGDSAARPAGAPGVSPRRLRWAAVSAAAILLIVLATLSWNYWKPASQTTHATVASAVGGTAPWFSVAILPFAAPGGGAADAQLAESLTRDLTVAFGRIRVVRVVSHALASTYKGKAIDARVVGRELNVRYLVEGEVRLAGEGFITDIQLIDTGTATQVWSNRLKLERGSAEQDPGALVTPLIQQLRVALSAAEHRRIGTQSASDATAMELVLRADNVLDRETDPLKGALEARKLYDEALRLDPSLIWALLGRGFTLDTELDLNRGVARDRLVQELDDLSMRAVVLDPDNPVVWRLRSKALAWQWRWDAALEANSKEQSLDPTRAGPIVERAWMMNMIGKPAEALPLMDRALALNPLDVLDVGPALRLRCRSYLVLGRYKDAIDACEKAGTFEDSWTVHLYLVAAYAHEGEVAKAEAAKAALLRRRPGFSIADLKARGTSNESAWLQQVETHLFAGLRKAGIPEQ
jgi:DNA-binding winged helix-turn-helix (wHTH) protein/TolB-like protein/tetratricopeptide (TPR) repeat protein